MNDAQSNYHPQGATQSEHPRPGPTPSLQGAPPAGRPPLQPTEQGSVRLNPLPRRPAATVPPSGFMLSPAPTGRRWELSGLTELVLALPWLWWSRLSIQFIGTPSTAVYVIAMIAWGAVAVGSLHPRVEDAMAWKVSYFG